MKFVAINLLLLSLNLDAAYGRRSAPDYCAIDEPGYVGCQNIEYIPDSTIYNENSECCSHSQCSDGECCRNFGFALYCMNPNHHKLSYSPVCNDEPVPGKCPGDIKQPDDCFVYSAFPYSTYDWEEIQDHPNTNCEYSEDCDGDNMCILFGDPENRPGHAWLECDHDNYFDDLLYVCLSPS